MSDLTQNDVPEPSTHLPNTTWLLLPGVFMVAETLHIPDGVNVVGATADV